MKKTLILILFSISCGFLHPQSADSVLKKFRENFQQKYFSVGLYLQTIGDYQSERTSGTNSFILSNARIKIFGEFDEGFGYYFQANLVNTQPILDAYVYHKFSNLLRVDVGQYKAPFSGEYLTSSSLIDFVYRAQVTNTLPPKRQIGVTLRGNITDELTYAAGVFNGNGMNTANENNYFLYSGRLAYTVPLGGGKLTFAANGAFSKDTGEEDNFNRLLLGGDFRFENDFVILSSEFIQRNMENLTTDAVEKENGYHLTAGYKICPELHVLGRYDVYNYLSDDDSNKLIIAGVNFFPTSITKFQFNYVVNSDNAELKYNQMLLKAQIAF